MKDRRSAALSPPRWILHRNTRVPKMPGNPVIHSDGFPRHYDGFPKLG